MIEWKWFFFIRLKTTRNMNQFKTNVLDGFLNSTDKTIHVGPIGAIDADNRYYHGYYMVESSYRSYTLQ